MSKDKPNTYDRIDIVRREGVMIADGDFAQLKLAAYRVRDPETQEYGPLQFHMTFNNTVMAVMGTEAAKLFSTFVKSTLEEQQHEPGNTSADQAGAGVPQAGRSD